MNQKRLNKVLKEMANQKITQMLVTDPAAIFYLTEKWVQPGQRMLVLLLNSKGDHRLFINELFAIQEDLDLEITKFNDTQDAVEILAKCIEENKRIGIDKSWPSRFLLRLLELKSGNYYVNSSDILDSLRMCKDQQEILSIQKVSAINDLAMERMIKLLPEKHSEKKMARLLSNIYEELGAYEFSFAPNISYGVNGANPHHKPGHCTLSAGDSIVIDIGCKKDFYCSDMTRTVFYKEASLEARDIYDIVLNANKRAIDIIKPGIRFCDIDTAARSCIEAAGYGKYFTHRTGHSIGLEAHDYGDVSSVNTQKIKPGMIFSIEPGIYLPGKFGVRIEDLVLVTEQGCEILNNYNKELTIVE